MKPLTQEQRDLVQAVLDGKTLQVEHQPICHWADVMSQAQALVWIANGTEVRIKPEPRKVTQEFLATDRGIWTKGAGIVGERIRVTYYPDEPNRDKRVTATLEDVSVEKGVNP